MTLTDVDLLSMQEVRILLHKATKAQKVYSDFSQKQIDKVCQSIADAGVANSKKLAKMAQEETGFGNWQDKTLKNIFASKTVNERYKNLKTVGIMDENVENKTIDMAVPVGVIAGLIPSTNPTSSVFYKSIIALKAGNAIVFSPHPNAKRCILEAIKIANEAAIKAGAPEGLISGMTILSLEGTDELMGNKETKMIIATGGGAMVHAAYSSGTPAIGVGPGNGSAYIERSADPELAVKRIIDSETFDNGTICASEQSIIVERSNKDAVHEELVKQGAYFLDDDEKDKLSKFLLRSDNTMNPQIVGKSVDKLANMADINIPTEAKVLIVPDYSNKIGRNNPYSREKLTPILAYYEVENCKEAASVTQKLLMNEGAGHTAILHSENQEVIREYSSLVPASRVIVNSPGALGGIGATTCLNPALTLGCGAIGGSSLSDNVGPMNLLNIKHIAVGKCELEDIRNQSGMNNISEDLEDNRQQLIDELVKQVLEKIK